MVDFQFYTQIYLGDRIPMQVFDRYAKRAEEELNRIQRLYQVTVPGSDSRDLAICAMAETLYDHSKRRGGITAASAGQVSVRYDNTDTADRQLRRELYEKAAIYLDIYRGVGA